MKIKELYLRTQFYKLFSFISFHTLHEEDVEELLMETVYEMKSKQYTNDQIEEALDYANNRIIEEEGTDILDNTGRYIVNRLINEFITFDEYGNPLPFDLDTN